MNTIEARRRLLGRNVYKRTTEGDPAIAQGSLARMYPGITMQGWTEQPQYEGKNLLNKNSSNWVVGKRFMWGDESGTQIEYSDDGVYAANILIEGIKPSTKYSFKNLDKSKIWVNRIIFADGLGNGYQNVPLYDNVEAHNHEEYSITSANNENITHAYFQVRTLPSSNGENVAITDQDIKDMLVCFSEGEPIYEPYTGGQRSPSPDYPQPITSAGKYNEDTQKWEYEVKLTGKNLFDAEYFRTTLDWKPAANGNGYSYIPIYIGKGKKITISTDGTPAEGLGFYCTISRTNKDTSSKVYTWIYHSNIANLIKTNVSFSVIEDDYIYFALNSGHNNIEKFLNAFTNFQIEISAQRTEYEPYKEQTVLLTSDRPLTKWDKLEKRNGQWGWVYKSAEIVLDGSDDEAWSNYSNYNGFLCSGVLYGTYTRTAGMCNQGVVDQGGGVGIPNTIWLGGNTASVYFVNNSYYNSDLEDEGLQNLKDHLSQIPVVIWYETKSETFVPLSESEQEAMNALYTFRPTTVLSNDEGCEMSLTYKTKKSLEVTT